LPFNPFRLQRKADKVIIRKRASRKAIVSIEEVGQEEMQCISVSSSDRTYITDDFVVTHNCMTGMLSERKDPFVTIMAFKELKEEYPEEFEPAELHLKTMSPGLHSAMEQWVPKLRVHYASWPEDVLKQFYATQHVLCAPSRGEGKNMPALEFQSMGGAVIATNWGGHTGWLSDEYAYPLNYKLMPLDGNGKVSNARADKDHMKALMLHTFRNRSEVKHKADLASEIIPQMMSWDAKVAQLYKKVAELVPGKGQEIYQKSLIPGGQNEQV
jgi:glycosyltransferase involved in cell wall biosynthesis